MEKPRLSIADAAGHMGIREEDVWEFLHLGRLQGSVGRDDLSAWVSTESMERLILTGAVTGPLGEMFDRQYAHLTPSYALYAVNANGADSVDVNLHWLEDVVLALEAKGVKLAELSPEPPRQQYRRQAPRYVALREALESVRITREK